MFKSGFEKIAKKEMTLNEAMQDNSSSGLRRMITKFKFNPLNNKKLSDSDVEAWKNKADAWTTKKNQELKKA